MSDMEQQTPMINSKRNQAVKWLAGLFATFSLAILLFAMYNSLISQGGLFDLVDTIVIVNSSVLLISSGLGWWLSRKNKTQLGAGIIFVANLLLGLGITFTVKSSATLTASYILMTSLLLIYLALNRETRLHWFIAMLFGIASIIVIEFINPAFRIQSLLILEIAPYVNIFLILLVLGLLAAAVRQAILGNVRTRLIVSFILIVLIPVTVITVATAYRSFRTQVPQALEIQSQIAKLSAQQVETFIRERENEIRTMADVSSFENLPLDEQSNLLTHLFATQNLYQELILTDSRGQELLYISRLDIRLDENLTSRAGHTEFETPKSTMKTYFGDVTLDKETGEPFMLISIPLFNLQTSELANVIIAKFSFKSVWDIMTQAEVLGSGTVYMIDSQNHVIAHPNPSIVLQGTRVDLPAENDFTIGIAGTEVAMAREPITLNGQTFSVIAEQPSAEALALPQSNVFITIALAVGMMVLAAGFGTYAAQRITNPIDQLATVAQAVSKGNFNIHAEIKSADEIGLLAKAFNSMTSQLRDLIGSLEQRVADRTAELEESSTQIQKRASQLEAISDVASSVASLQDVDQLLPYITKIVSERFGFYHVGIFLLSDNKKYAVLRAANSEGGQVMLARKHQLRVGQEGIVGYSVEQKRARIALDVGDDAVYFNNPDLPATRSELALPLMIGHDVIGVLDVQSEEPNAFSNEDIEVLSTLANQVAVAIENARLFQQSQDALKELDKTFQKYISSEWRQFASQTKVVGYRAHEAGLDPITKVQERARSKSSNGNLQKIPIKLRGITLGSLNVDMGDRKDGYTEEENTLIQTVADRLAMALESARLLDESQRAAAKEQAIGEITGKIGSSINLRNVLQTAVEELGQAIPGSEVVIQLNPKSGSEAN